MYAKISKLLFPFFQYHFLFTKVIDKKGNSLIGNFQNKTSKKGKKSVKISLIFYEKKNYYEGTLTFSGI
jgi:hypothetical protein